MNEGKERQELIKKISEKHADLRNWSGVGDLIEISALNILSLDELRKYYESIKDKK